MRGVVGSMLGLLEEGATHLGIGTDHVVESFRNALWPGYKTGEGLDPALRAQFRPLEDALTAPGLVVWPVVARSAAAAVLARYRHLEGIPRQAADWEVAVRGAARLAATLGEQREHALLFRQLATLRADVPIRAEVDGLH